jgi:hypothetical protein
MATFDVLDGVFPTYADLSIGTSETELEIPIGATLVYAQCTHATQTATYAPRASTSVALSISSTAPTLVWSGPRSGGHRSVYLKGSAGSTTVDVVAFSTL